MSNFVETLRVEIRKGGFTIDTFSDSLIKLGEQLPDVHSAEGRLFKWAELTKGSEIHDGVSAAILYRQFRKCRNTLVYVKAVQLWNKFVTKQNSQHV